MDRPEALCRVCGDKASGKHYGVASCDGCRGFFKRSIRRYRNKTLDYVCKENGGCVVDVTRRNQCQACRFQKCLQVSMKKDAVQHERAPRSVQKRPLFASELPSVSSLTGSVLTSGSGASLPALPPYYPGFFSPSAFKPGSLAPFLPPAPPLAPLTLTLSHNSAFRPSVSALTKSHQMASSVLTSSCNNSNFMNTSTSSVVSSFMNALSPQNSILSPSNSALHNSSFLQPYNNAFVSSVGFLYNSEPRLPSVTKLNLTPPSPFTPPVRTRQPVPLKSVPPFSAESLAKSISDSVANRVSDSQPRDSRVSSDSHPRDSRVSSDSQPRDPRVSSDSQPRDSSPRTRKRKNDEDEVTSSGNLCTSIDTKVSSPTSTDTLSVSTTQSTTCPFPSSPSSIQEEKEERIKRNKEEEEGDRIEHLAKRCREDNNNYIKETKEQQQLIPSSPSPACINDQSPSESLSLASLTPSPPTTPTSCSSGPGSLFPPASRSEPPLINSFIDLPARAIADGIHESAARLLFVGVKWARSIPAFMQLSFRDQAILLEESWSELYLVSAAQWGLPVPEESSKPSFSFASEIRVMQDLCNRFLALNVDATEFACLKALILFRPEAKGLRDSRGVEALQDQTQMMFHEYLSSKVGATLARVRVGKLLLLLPPLTHVSATSVQEIFFRKTVGNIPIERVLCDMFKSC